MPIHMMTRRCIHCRRKYTYNPSVGNLGLICPHCGKSQRMPPQRRSPKPKLQCRFPIRFPWKPKPKAKKT